MTLGIRDNPHAVEELDEFLARVREEILAANPADVEVAVASPKRYGGRTLPGQFQLWWEPTGEGER